MRLSIYVPLHEWIITVTSYTNAGLRNGQTYRLDVYGDYGDCTSREFIDLSALARAIGRVRYACERVTRWHLKYGGGHSDAWLRTRVQAYSSRGRILDVVELCAWGVRQDTQPRMWRGAPPGYVRRQTSVPHVGRPYGGPFSKGARYVGESRMNSAHFADEGEPECRARRRPSYLYDRWDGRNRSNERCWKAQHKGRKAWER